MTEYQPEQFNSLEQILNQDSKDLITRFATLREKFGVTNPDDLPEDKKRVRNILEDQDEWTVDVDRLAASIGTLEAAEEANFLKTSFYVTAGFTDKTYLLEVYDWLQQDEERVSVLGLDDLAVRIRSTMQMIVDILDQN